MYHDPGVQKMQSVRAMVAVAAILFSLSGSLKASEVASSALTRAQQYHLRLHHLHTGEDIDVVYRVGNTYLPAGLVKLNSFLRSHPRHNPTSSPTTASTL